MEDKAAPARPLWDRLEHERSIKGWGVKELAERARLQRSVIYRLKTGTRPPWPETVVALADAIGIPRAEAVKLAGLTPDSDTRPDDNERKIMALQIPDDEKEELLKTYRSNRKRREEGEDDARREDPPERGAS